MGKDEIKTMVTDLMDARGPPEPKAKKPRLAPRAKSLAKNGGKKGVKSLQAGAMTQKEFTQLAAALAIQVGEHSYRAEPRTFSTGSSGWFSQQKLPFKIGDKELT